MGKLPMGFEVALLEEDIVPPPSPPPKPKPKKKKPPSHQLPKAPSSAPPAVAGGEAEAFPEVCAATSSDEDVDAADLEIADDYEPPGSNKAALSGAMHASGQTGTKASAAKAPAAAKSKKGDRVRIWLSRTLKPYILKPLLLKWDKFCASMNSGPLCCIKHGTDTP